MGTEYKYISENYKRICAEIEEAKVRYRKPDDRTDIVAVTKTVPPEAVNFAVSCGIRLLGENRVQEYESKKAFYDPSAEVHFIGHLQTNKVKYIVGEMKLIHSVDSIKLASEINRQAAKKGIQQEVLAEVNIGGEESKSGIRCRKCPISG